MKEWRNRIGKAAVILLLGILMLNGTAFADVVSEYGSAEKTTVTAGLKKENGSWYYYSKGKRICNKWKTLTVNGRKYRYYFGKDGKALCGRKQYGDLKLCVRKISGVYYGFDEKAHRVTGIRVSDKKFYYFDKKGKANLKIMHSLRRATVKGESVCSLVSLLNSCGAVKKREVYMQGSCAYPGGNDGIWYYDKFQIQICRLQDGSEVLLGIYPN